MKIEPSTWFKIPTVEQQPKASLGAWLGEKALETNQQLLNADHELQQLAANKVTNLHQSMLVLEEAKLSFQFLEQIRNRLMTAYQDILREQI